MSASARSGTCAIDTAIRQDRSPGIASVLYRTFRIDCVTVLQETLYGSDPENRGNWRIPSRRGDHMMTRNGGLTAQPWKELYQAAISESDLSKLPTRLSDAEAALVARARELFYTIGDDGEEGESLDYAMCILHALRESLNHRDYKKPATSPQPRAVPMSLAKWQSA